MQCYNDVNYLAYKSFQIAKCVLIATDLSFNFTGDSPVVRDDIVTFHLSLGSGVIEAKCAVLQGAEVLEEVNCKLLILFANHFTDAWQMK